MLQAWHATLPPTSLEMDTSVHVAKLTYRKTTSRNTVAIWRSARSKNVIPVKVCSLYMIQWTVANSLELLRVGVGRFVILRCRCHDPNRMGCLLDCTEISGLRNRPHAAVAEDWPDSGCLRCLCLRLLTPHHTLSLDGAAAKSYNDTINYSRRTRAKPQRQSPRQTLHEDAWRNTMSQQSRRKRDY